MDRLHSTVSLFMDLRAAAEKSCEKVSTINTNESTGAATEERADLFALYGMAGAPTSEILYAIENR